MNKYLLLIIYFLFWGFYLADGNGKLKMVFRYDDFILTPSIFNDSLIYIFQKNEIPLNIGVIPFDTSNSLINNFSSEQLKELKSRIQKKEIEVALHGFNHRNILKTPWLTRVSFSEFKTVPYAIQYEHLLKGKMALDSLLQIKTKVFIPPFNTYDKNTLKALEKLDFEVISGSMFGISLNNKLKYIPASCNDFFDLQMITEKFKDKNFTIILYFHPYSFKEGSSQYSKDQSQLITFSQLDSILHFLKKKNISFYTFSDLTRTGYFDNALYKGNSHKWNLLKKILYNIKLYHYGVYSSMRNSKQNKVMLFIGNIILHILDFLLVYFVAYFILKILHLRLKFIFILIGISLMGILIYLYYIRNDFSLGIILILFLVNLLAIFFSLIRIYKPFFNKTSNGDN